MDRLLKAKQRTVESIKWLIDDYKFFSDRLTIEGGPSQ